MPTKEVDEDFDIIDLLRRAPVREREEWVVVIEFPTRVREFWTGTKWTDTLRKAAHYADIEGGMAVVQFLEPFQANDSKGRIYTVPLAEIAR